MVSKRIGLVLCAVLALAGCGGAEKAGPQSPSSPSYGYQPSANTSLRVVFQNVRSPLQYGAGYADPYGRSAWGW